MVGVTGSGDIATAHHRGPAAWSPPVIMTDLERFWPSRRGHAFDEFCRAATR